MSCEICGRKIIDRPNRIVVEGLQLMACHRCSEHGEKVKFDIEKIKSGISKRSKIGSRMKKASSKKFFDNIENLEVIEDYSEKIKEGRGRMGISQEELAKYLKEKLSVVQKIETGKIIPSIKLSREIEHILKIKLLSAPKKEIENKSQVDSSSALTIGDIIQLKKGETE
jgi:putative transcription factor